MTTDHWQQLETVFQAALERPPRERAAYLAGACADDAALLQEAEKLLASFDSASSFLETPAAESLGLAGAAAVAPGQHIAHYEILSALGVGGMGEVYLARDARLERRIALKLLPAHFSHDAAWIERFTREARAASALNHPNILTIYEIGEDAGTHFIAAEYVSGQTLRHKLNAGRPSVRESVAIARQIAHALSAAHEAGIIHRDIKPENVMIRPDGLVKVLDFGLAKPLGGRRAEGGERSERDADAPQAARGARDSQTDPAMLFGTAAYLSPEQARHEELDARTDVFSLGIVLHELLTGARPGNGVLALSNLPPALARIVTRSLAPERTHRYAGAAELCAALEQYEQSLSTKPVLTKRNRIVAAVAAGLFVVATIWFWRTARVTSSALLSFNAAAAQKLTDLPGQEIYPSLSPDGQTVVYAGRHQQQEYLDIYRQTVGSRTATNLTEGVLSADFQPAFSPDGARIAFRSSRNGGGIFVMQSDGSQVTQITDAGFNPAWSPDGREIVVADELTWDYADRNSYPNVSRLWAVNVETHARRYVTQRDAVQPNWSPHGHRIAFWGEQKGGHRDIWTVAATGGELLPVTDDEYIDWNPVWSPTGEHLYFLSNRGGEMNLWRVAIDEATGALRSTPEPATLPSNHCQYVAFARNGSALVYSQLTRSENLWQLAFDPVTETVSDAPLPLTQTMKRYAMFAFSPDETSFVYLARGEPQQDLFIADLKGLPRQRLTDDAAQDIIPRWSPDGNWIAFLSDRSGKYEIWKVSPDGTGLAPMTHEPGEEVIAPLWSPDSRKLLYLIRSKNAYLIDASRSGTEQTPQALPGAMPSGFLSRDWSPDGQWLAGWQPRVGNAPAGLIVYSFAQQRYTQITDFGLAPVWLNDNRRLLFQTGNHLYLTDRTGKSPRKLYTVKSPNQLGQHALSRDNRRIYFSEANSEADLWLQKLR